MSPEKTPEDRYNKNVTAEFRQFHNIGDEVHGKLVVISAHEFHDERGSRTVGRYTVDEDGHRVTFLGTEDIDQMLAGKLLGYDFRLVYDHDEKSASNFQVKKFMFYEA